MTKLESDLLKLSEGKSLEFAANYAAIIPQIIEVLKALNTPEGFEQAYSEIYSPIVKRPYPRLENGDYKYIEIDQGWKLWQAATAKAVPEGFVLVPQESLKVALAWMHEDIDPWQMGGDSFADLYEHKPILEKALVESQEQSHD